MIMEQPFFKEGENGFIYRPHFAPELNGVCDGYEIVPNTSACISCNNKNDCMFAFDPYCDAGECLDNK